MRKRPILPALLTTSLLLVIFSCSKGGDGDDTPAISCAGVTKTFSADVNPIIQTYCNQAGCHDVASVNGPGPLTNYNQVFSAKDLIKTQIAAGLMPQNATLSAAQKQSIICWINSGAPNN